MAHSLIEAIAAQLVVTDLTKDMLTGDKLFTCLFFMTQGTAVDMISRCSLQVAQISSISP